jgi:hypothetical protein
MKKASIYLWAIALAAATVGTAHAGGFDTIYEDRDVTSLRPRYERAGATITTTCSARPSPTRSDHV